MSSQSPMATPTFTTPLRLTTAAPPQMQPSVPVAAANSTTTAPTTRPIKRRGRRSTYGEIRGRVQLFKVYFDTTDGTGRKRRLSKAQQSRRFAAYKRQIWEEYGVEIKGTLKSEKAYIARYGQPTRFLKYKLDRTTNLTPEELRDEDLKWYLEIGGKLSYADLVNSLPNIDSIDDAGLTTRNTRRRLNPSEDASDLPPDMASSLPSQLLSTFESQPELDVLASLSNSNHNSNAAAAAASQASQTAKVEEKTDGEYAPALNVLHRKQTLYEKEQSEKKNMEMRTLFTTKCTVIKEVFAEMLTEHPEYTGFIPFCSTGGQDQNSFDFWLAVNKEQIKTKVADVGVLIQQISVLLEDVPAWKLFLRKWKWQRIFKDNKFNPVWDWVANELNVEQRCGKEEMDYDEDEDDDLKLDMINE